LVQSGGFFIPLAKMSTTGSLFLRFSVIFSLPQYYFLDKPLHDTDFRYQTSVKTLYAWSCVLWQIHKPRAETLCVIP